MSPSQNPEGLPLQSSHTHAGLRDAVQWSATNPDEPELLSTNGMSGKRPVRQRCLLTQPLTPCYEGQVPRYPFSGEVS